jgi:hypothetical protein
MTCNPAAPLSRPTVRLGLEKGLFSNACGGRQAGPVRLVPKADPTLRGAAGRPARRAWPWESRCATTRAVAGREKLARGGVVCGSTGTLLWEWGW